MRIEPYLFFDGNCEEALEFYKGALGAEVTFSMRYKESPEPAPPGMVPPDYGDKIMHASLEIDGQRVLAADGCGMHKSFEGFSLAITVPDEKRGNAVFDALAKGGEVVKPMGKTFFAPSFGMVTDRFGVEWMVLVEQKR